MQVNVDTAGNKVSPFCTLMQHWHVYQKWNERLFHEMYSAFQTGRWSKDPSAGWYQGEIGFFDNYIIPLAKKLKDCGVFGVSSDGKSIVVRFVCAVVV